MFHVIFYFLACLLAVYGAYSLVCVLFEAIRAGSLPGSRNVKVVVAVRDAEEQIENIVRNAVKDSVAAKLMSEGNITFIDMGSKDDTYLMLQKLQKEYEMIDVVSVKACLERYSHVPSPER